MSVHSSQNSVLYYVHDPMCSWCWGYAPTFAKLVEALPEELNVEYLVGGLAADNDEAMPLEMQQFLQQTWRRIHSDLGTEFNFEFWEKAKPRRSTYPACRAVLAAKHFGLEKPMVAAIQQAYYLQARNPSDVPVLIELAVSLGIDEQAFSAVLGSVEIEQQLHEQIHAARALPINGFPSLVLNKKGQHIAVPLDYLNFTRSLEFIKSHLAD